MTLRGIFSYQNLDSTSDLNALNAKIVDRGIYDNGLLIPSATSLEVSIAPFVAVSYDGMVVQSDAAETVTIPANATSYLVCFAKWLNGSSPQLSIEVLTEVEWGTSINRDYFITFAKLVVPLGATAILDSYISYSNADYADKAGKNTWRPRVSNYALLPLIGNRHGDARIADNRAYYWDSTLSVWSPLLSGELSNMIISNWNNQRTIGSTVPIHDIAYNEDNQRYVAVGEKDGTKAAIYMSEDRGITWSQQTTGVDALLEDLYSIDLIDFSGTKLFIAVGATSSGTAGVVGVSSDGETWIAIPMTYVLRKVKAFNNNEKMAAVGDNGAIYYTTSGISWSNYRDTAAGATDNKDIAYDGSTNWVITGLTGIIRQNDDITDGTGWVTRESSGSSTVQSVDHGNGVFVAAMGPQVYVSADAITWTAYVAIQTGYAATLIKYVETYARFLLFCYKSSSDGVKYLISSNGSVYEDLTGSVVTTEAINGIAMDERDTLCVIDSLGLAHFTLRV